MVGIGTRAEAPTGSAAIWHDVECAGYAADLSVWRDLARAHGGPVLDLGCGTGRVALDLAAHGTPVTGVDCDPELVHALAARARGAGAEVTAQVADIRALSLSGPLPLAIAPMQVVQLLGGAAGRESMLASVRAVLPVGGILALALADPFEALPPGEFLPPLPDVLERDGWVYSSAPLAVRIEPGGAAIDRLRQAVSPEGELLESMATIVLDEVTAQELEQAGGEQGFSVLPRRSVPSTESYVGSTVVVLERAR